MAGSLFLKAQIGQRVVSKSPIAIPFASGSNYCFGPSPDPQITPLFNFTEPSSEAEPLVITLLPPVLNPSAPGFYNFQMQPTLGFFARIRWGMQSQPSQIEVDFAQGVAFPLWSSYVQVDAINELGLGSVGSWFAGGNYVGGAVISVPVAGSAAQQPPPYIAGVSDFSGDTAYFGSSVTTQPNNYWFQSLQAGGMAGSIMPPQLAAPQQYPQGRSPTFTQVNDGGCIWWLLPAPPTASAYLGPGTYSLGTPRRTKQFYTSGQAGALGVPSYPIAAASSSYTTGNIYLVSSGQTGTLPPVNGLAGVGVSAPVIVPPYAQALQLNASMSDGSQAYNLPNNVLILFQDVTASQIQAIQVVEPGQNIAIPSDTYQIVLINAAAPGNASITSARVVFSLGI